MYKRQLYTKGLSGVETGKAAIMATVEPAVAAILSVVLFKEVISFEKMIGILLIFGSVVVLNMNFHRKREAVAS